MRIVRPDIIKCDRCGAEIESKPSTSDYEIFDVQWGKDLDLCNLCQKDLITFMNEYNKNEKTCENCDYCVNNYGYNQCFAQKNAPRVKSTDTCNVWTRRVEE